MDWLTKLRDATAGILSEIMQTKQLVDLRVFMGVSQHNFLLYENNSKFFVFRLSLNGQCQWPLEDYNQQM